MKKRAYVVAVVDDNIREFLFTDNSRMGSLTIVKARKALRNKGYSVSGILSIDLIMREGDFEELEKDILNIEF